MWQLATTTILDINTDIFQFPQTFSLPELVVKTTPNFIKDEWRFFGEVEQFVFLPDGLGQTLVKVQQLRLGQTILYLDTTYPYELRFRVFWWLPEVTIDIWTNT